MIRVRGIKKKLKLINDDYIARLFHKECRIGVDDVLVGSFPRSGRTWIRFFVGAYISHYYELGIEVSWDNFVTLAPGPLCNEESGLMSFPKGIDRVIFSHNRPIGRYFPGRKVVYVTRNFLDILVSSYFFHKQRSESSCGSSVNDYARRQFDFEEAIDRINYFSQQLTTTSDLLIMPYESMREDPEQWFRRFIMFTNYGYDEGAFSKAMDHSSFSSMRKMELEQREYDSEEGLHTRQGAVNRGTDYLDENTVEYVQHFLDQNLKGLLRKYYLGRHRTSI